MVDARFGLVEHPLCSSVWCHSVDRETWYIPFKRHHAVIHNHSSCGQSFASFIFSFHTIFISLNFSHLCTFFFILLWFFFWIVWKHYAFIYAGAVGNCGYWQVSTLVAQLIGKPFNNTRCGRRAFQHFVLFINVRSMYTHTFSLPLVSLFMTWVTSSVNLFISFFIILRMIYRIENYFLEHNSICAVWWIQFVKTILN